MSVDKMRERNLKMSVEVYKDQEEGKYVRKPKKRDPKVLEIGG
jgi:hypothetical protein